MKVIKVSIIGSNSDLIQPLLNSENKYIQIQKVSRADWNLESPNIPLDLLDQISLFNPDQILFAAAINNLTSITQDPKEILNQIDEHMAINFRSLLAISISIQQLRSKPLKAIHVISSLYGIYGRKNRLPYVVSKHALEGAVKCLAIEYPETQVLGYRPGFFESKLTDQNLSIQSKELISRKIPSGKLGLPEDLSNLLLHNILYPSPYQTGTCITIDGGLTSGGIFDL